MEVLSIRTPGLGDSTYLLGHRGTGILVDPQRDVDRFLAAAKAAGVQIRYVLETHVHNDYVSGATEAARRTGAELVLPAAAAVAYDHVSAFHKEDLGGEHGIVIRPLHTPGHTPEHTSYLVLIDGVPVALFSGGSLLAGSAGRSDLLGPVRARQLAIAQFHSLRRLTSLPDEVPLLPTHGEGSFCSAGRAGAATSTIGTERRWNPALAYPDAQAFADAQIRGLPPYPAYYADMAPINIAGPAPLPPLAVPELTAQQVAVLDPAVSIVDARPRQQVAAGYIPGALAIELGDQFGTWAGWLLPFNAEIALVLDTGQSVEEAVVQLARIGFDRVRGVLRGMAGWRAAGYAVATFATVDVDRFAAALRSGEAAQVLDVRSPGEWETARLAGSTHRYLPDVAAGGVNLDPARPVWIACGSGYRATTAATLMQRAGYQPVVLTGGVPDLLARDRKSVV